MQDRSSTRNMAVFCDFENVALGVRDAKYAAFDIRKVLERLLLKGNIVVKKAYCDWDRYKEFKRAMHEATFELIEIPHVRQSGKNSADIRMVVDALDLCYTKSHVDMFVIISGDSDFTPLVSKLRENNKTVVGVGVKSSSSDLLVKGCDEFIFYDDLVREDAREPEAKRRRRRAATPRKATSKKAAPAAGAKDGTPEAMPDADAPRVADTEIDTVRTADAENDIDAARAGEPDAEQQTENRQQDGIDLVMRTVEDLFRERGLEEKVWASMVKQTLKRRHPGFNETYHGFRTFGKLLEEAQARNLLQLELDEKSGGYIITRVTG